MGDPDMADLALGLPCLHQRQDNPGICHAAALHQVDHRAPHAEFRLIKAGRGMAGIAQIVAGRPDLVGHEDVPCLWHLGHDRAKADLG
jgi:hypothetical protein